jgi:hypothetical protein|tara:strand:+ start:108 stop:884 length:777 start_codon:yes stop_codon:yes gene_type:complete
MEPALGDMVIPNALYDAEKSSSQPYGSSEVRASQVKRACQDEYAPVDVLQVAAANPGTDARCDAVLGAGTCDLADEDDEAEVVRLGGDTHLRRAEAACTEPEDQPNIKAACQTELVLSLAARSVNMFVMPFLIICLSVMALKCGVAEDAWATLQSLNVVRSKTWITTFAQDVAVVLMHMALTDPDNCQAVRFVVGDNCSYKSHIVHEHVDRAGEMLHTVNWLSVPLSLSKLGVGLSSVQRGKWMRTAFDRFSVRGRLR